MKPSDAFAEFLINGVRVQAPGQSKWWIYVDFQNAADKKSNANSTGLRTTLLAKCKNGDTSLLRVMGEKTRNAITAIVFATTHGGSTLCIYTHNSTHAPPATTTTTAAAAAAKKTTNNNNNNNNNNNHNNNHNNNNKNKNKNIN